MSFYQRPWNPDDNPGRSPADHLDFAWQAVWDEANDMSEFDVESLTAYLEREDTLFVACHEVVEGGRTLLGTASSRLEIKPRG